MVNFGVILATIPQLHNEFTFVLLIIPMIVFISRYEAMRVAISQEMEHRAYNVSAVAITAGSNPQEAIYSNQLAMTSTIIHEQHQPNASGEGPRIEEMPPDAGPENSQPLYDGTEAGNSNLYLPGDQETKQLNKVSSVDNPHPQILEEMRMRALNSDFESGV